METPAWWPVLLLAVFATHLPFFAWRWRRTGELRFAATTLTFALLVATYALRVFAPALRVAGAPLWSQLRVVAWASAVVSIALLLRRGLAALGERRRRRAAQAARKGPPRTGN